MKDCIHCQTPMEDDALVCPACGKAAEEEIAEEAVEEAAEAAPAAEPAPKKNRAGLIVGLCAAVLVLVGAIAGKGLHDQSKQPEEPVTLPQEIEAPADGTVMTGGYHTNAHGYDSYSIHYSAAADGSMTYAYMDETGKLCSVPAADAEAMMDQVVATCGEMALTNEELAYYYSESVYGLYNMYGDFLPYLFNTALPHDEQMDPENTQTWQAFLLESALNRFRQVAALNQTATAAGVTLAQEDLDYLEANTDFDAMAVSYGLADGDALMEAQFGPGSSTEGYRNFMKTVLLAAIYSNQLYEESSVTDEEIEAYYDANADMMVNAYGIEKNDQNMVNVRHILIQPTAGEDGTISDEAWSEAEAEAYRIYDEWLAGGATEEGFAEAAGTYTQDPGSMSTGGLYENVYPGQMVPEFNDWCFAEDRKVGDHGVVKTTYGYHIMFFSGEAEMPYWQMAAADLCRQEKVNEQRASITAGYEQTTDLNKVVLLTAIAPTMPAVEEAPAEEAPAEETPVEPAE